MVRGRRRTDAAPAAKVWLRGAWPHFGASQGPAAIASRAPTPVGLRARIPTKMAVWHSPTSGFLYVTPPSPLHYIRMGCSRPVPLPAVSIIFHSLRASRRAPPRREACRDVPLCDIVTGARADVSHTSALEGARHELVCARVNRGPSAPGDPRAEAWAEKYSIAFPCQLGDSSAGQLFVRLCLCIQFSAHRGSLFSLLRLSSFCPFPLLHRVLRTGSSLLRIFSAQNHLSSACPT